MKHVRLVLACLLLAAWLSPARADTAAAASADGSFRDCPACPAMVKIPPGKFTMGEDVSSRDKPVHPVSIVRPFAIGKYDVSFAEWDACAADGGCAGYHPDDFGWGRGRRPVINVSWNDAQAYATWLSRKTGKHYRLPSEAEFEYATRAGSTTAFWWGQDFVTGNANCDGCGTQWGNVETAPVGSFKPNAFGLYDMVGNVSKWVQDLWHDNYEGAPQDGSAWETGDPKRRVLRSGSWFNNKGFMHSGYRNGDAPIVKNRKLGFRIARDS